MFVHTHGFVRVQARENLYITRSKKAEKAEALRKAQEEKAKAEAERARLT